MNKLLSFSEKFFVAGTAFVVLLVMGFSAWTMWGPSLSTPAAAVSVPPAFDAASSANTGSNTASTLTWNHAVGSGADRLLLVGVSIRNSSSQTVSSVTYNSISLTKVQDAKNSTNASAELWRLVNPPSGVFPIVVTLSSSARFVAGATSYTGVNQTTPLGTAVSATGSNTTPTVTVASAADELAVDVVASKSSNFTLIVGSGQTERYQNTTTNSTGGTNVRGGGSTEPGASSNTMSWTLSGSTTWAIVGVSIKPSPVPDTTPPVISNVNASSITTAGATITWNTDEPADSQVEYGLTTSYGSQTTLDPALVTSHSQTVTGLTPSTLYHYRVKSKDAAGNLATSTDFTFTTIALSARPNVIVIMTDDQDKASASVMTKLQSLIAQLGVTFNNFFVSNPLCCPSRAVLLTGQFAHNNGVMNNNPGYTGMSHISTLPVWLQTAGYFTSHIGAKYMNGYGFNDPNPSDGIPACHDIPPGWDDWQTMVTPSGSPAYNEYYMNDQGQLIKYGSPTALPSGCVVSQSVANVYSTDLLAQEAENLINQRAGATDGKPFFLWLNFFAPHGKAVAAPRHQGIYGSAQLPNPPSFNEADVSDKPAFISTAPLLSQATINTMTTEYRDRLETLLAVDEGIDKIVTALANTNQLANTVIIFTSDNGWLQGEHRWRRKSVLYEESIRVPLVVRGPGFSSNATLNQLVMNVDLASTILELAQATAGKTQDGKSFVPLLQGTPVPWRNYMLLEGEYKTNNTFTGVRDSQYVYIEHNTGEKELYDLTLDPYQLTSQHNNSAYDTIKSVLQGKLNILKTCAGGSCWQ